MTENYSTGKLDEEGFLSFLVSCLYINSFKYVFIKAEIWQVRNGSIVYWDSLSRLFS